MKSFIFLITLTAIAAGANLSKIKDETIALVKVKDTIYHCSEITETICGYNLRCEKIDMYCVGNITVEYL